MVDRRRDEQLLRALFETAPNGVMAVDVAGNICMANAQLEKMFGYSREELIGRSVEMLVPMRLRRGHLDLRKRFAAAPEPRLMGTGRDLCAVRKDGSEFSVEVGLNSATDIGDLFVVTVVDITARKRAAERASMLERAQERLETCQQLGMAAVVLQSDGRMLSMNTLLRQLRSQLVVTGDRIKVSDPPANDDLMRALAGLGSEGSGEIARVIPVAADDDHPALVLYLLPMKGLFGTLGVLIVTTLGEPGTPAVKLVQSLFALTAAEAKVATLIGSGLSPRATARQLDLSEGTVRTTLKRVFAKVGVSRQNELAVLLSKLTAVPGANISQP